MCLCLFSYSASGFCRAPIHFRHSISLFLLPAGVHSSQYCGDEVHMKTTGRIHWRIKHTINDLSQFCIDNLDKLVHGCWESECLLASSSGWNGEVPIQSSLAFTALPHSSILLFISCKLSIPSVVKVNIATTGGASCSSGRGGV